MNRAIQYCGMLGMVVILAATSLSATAGKNHYRWLDDRGNPVHSDRPPPEGIDYEVISTGSSLVREVDAEEGAVPPEIEPTVGNEFDQVDTARSEIEKNPEYCERARSNLETLNTAGRIRLRNDQGEYRYLTDEEKEEQRKRATEAIRVHCE